MKISRKQNAVYWAPLAANGMGRVTFDDPVDVAVRWENKNEIFVNAQGQEERSLSIAYPASAVALNGYMWLGEVSDLPSDDSPRGVSGAVQIKSVYDCPSVNGRSSLSKVWLG
jgi:hypothetical protein